MSTCHRSCSHCVFRGIRNEEDSFSNDVFQNVRSAYKRGMLNTIKSKSKEHQLQLQKERDIYEQKLDLSRASATREQDVALAAQKARLQQETTSLCAQARPYPWLPLLL
jgi:tRNA A37 methylthiotransferase MiaB